MSKPLKIFITYAHKNTAAKDELITHLAVMKRERLISIWHDNEITAGDTWRDAIFSNLDDSDILLYLVSAYSLASDNCNKELAAALNANIKVIPIILESCDWLNHQLSDFQALPDKGKPITEWEHKSAGWQNVIEGIRGAISKMQSQVTPSSAISEAEILAELTCQRGNVLLLLGQVDSAVKTYSQTIEFDPRHAFAYNNRGIAYDRKREINKALKDYDEAIRLKKDFSEAYYNRGITYREKDEVDLAIEDFNKAIQLNPQFARAYSNRGNVYDMKNDVDRAIRDHNRSIELDFNNPIFYNNRGITYGKKDEVDLAIEDFNKAIDLKCDYAIAYNNRGAVYRKDGEYDKAIDDCTKAIQLNPNYAEPYSNRGAAYRNKGDYDRAIEDYNKAIQLKPNFVQAYYNRGLAYHEKCDFDLAIKNYSKAIELNPKLFHAYNNRGNAYLQKGNFDSAIEDYNRAIELNPELGLAYYNRSEAWLHLKEWDKAKADLIAAKKLGMDIIAAFHNAYKNVETFEKRKGFKVRDDVALMLTQRLRNRYPKTLKILDADGKPLESPNVVNLREQLRNTGTPLGKYLKAKPAFGINTAPTEAFVVDKTTRRNLIAAHPSSTDILKPFLHGRDLRRWHAEPQGKWLIFAHRGIAINEYPAILKHLEKHKDPLSKRAGKQAWYELQASRSDPDRFARPKLVCPNLYEHQTFAVDTAGFYCGNTAYLIPTEETWLCGLLNSRVVEWFYSQVSNQLTIDYLRARSGYMQQIPVPDITSTQQALIGQFVEYLIYLQQQPTINSRDLAYARDRKMLRYFERIIDGMIYESYLPDELHKGSKHFFQPLLDEQLPQLEDIQGDKMSACREIFEQLYEKTHPVAVDLFFMSSVKPIRIIESRT